MKSSETFNLIEGVFSTDEAREILMNIFSTKIQFHEMKNLSSEERFGEQDTVAKKRIPQLKIELEKLEKIISEAKSGTKKFAITSEINILLVEE